MGSFEGTRVDLEEVGDNTNLPLSGSPYYIISTVFVVMATVIVI